MSAGVALVAALALLSSGGLTGQEKDRKDPGASKKAVKGQLPRDWEKLDLTDAQKDEIIKLNAEHKAKRDKLMQEVYRLDAELARKRVAVLNDDQRKKLVDIVIADPPKESPAEKEMARPPEKEKEKPKGKNPDK
jgi:hypothetical protein